MDLTNKIFNYKENNIGKNIIKHYMNANEIYFEYKALKNKNIQIFLIFLSLINHI